MSDAEILDRLRSLLPPPIRWDEINMTGCLEDTLHLKSSGYWQDNEVPKWALELSEYYEVSPTDKAVLESALVYSLWRLRLETLEEPGK